MGLLGERGGVEGLGIKGERFKRRDEVWEKW